MGSHAGWEMKVLLFLHIQVEGYLGPPLSDEDMEIQTCIEPGEAGHEQPKDYSNYLNFITGYMTFFILVFIFFFRTEMKRCKT